MRDRTENRHNLKPHRHRVVQSFITGIHDKMYENVCPTQFDGHPSARVGTVGSNDGRCVCVFSVWWGGYYLLWLLDIIII